LDDADGMNEGEPVWIFVCLQRRFVQQATNGEVRHQQAVELLFHEFGRLTPQHNLGAAQVGFQFRPVRFLFPSARDTTPPVLWPEPVWDPE
jgi:hypothetical protein